MTDEEKINELKEQAWTKLNSIRNTEDLIQAMKVRKNPDSSIYDKIFNCKPYPDQPSEEYKKLNVIVHYAFTVFAVIEFFIAKNLNLDKPKECRKCLEELRDEVEYNLESIILSGDYKGDKSKIDTIKEFRDFYRKLSFSVNKSLTESKIDENDKEHLLSEYYDLIKNLRTGKYISYDKHVSVIKELQNKIPSTKPQGNGGRMKTKSKREKVKRRRQLLKTFKKNNPDIDSPAEIRDHKDSQKYREYTEEHFDKKTNDELRLIIKDDLRAIQNGT